MASSLASPTYLSKFVLRNRSRGRGYGEHYVRS